MHLSADDIGQRFGRRVLFRRLTFELTGGRSLAITGANGSGKSTLVRILAGVLAPTRGTVRLEVGGEDVPREERPFRCGLVAPYLNVYDGFTARENLRFLARARHATRPDQDAEGRIDEVLAFVGLAGRGDDLVQTYSSGMVQRVRVAAALLFRPPLLLLDEPSSNLDAPGIAMIERVVGRQIDRGRLLIIATNDAREAALCDTAIRVEDFR